LYFTLPDGTKEGFTFSAQPVAMGYWQSAYYYKPIFTPLAGTKSTLLYDGGQELMSDGWGGYTTTLAMGDDYPYTPFNGFYGGVSIQLRNGTILNFDANDGVLTSAKDTFGNMLYFHENGIEHSSGKSVVFERDYDNRITAITGPDGKRVEYTYDSLGNLVAVKDQSNSTVQFTYQNAPQHYLDKVIDPLGRTAAKTEFDEQGRIKKVIDADGKTIEYEFDTEARIQKVTDQLGNTTTIENDERGNVIREVSPEGAITLRTYDGNNNVLTETQVVIHNGVEIKLTTTYTYDADGNKSSETDARGNITTYTYNKYGQVVSTTSGGVTTVTNYDANTGLPTTTTDVNGNVTNYKFDERGNMTSLVNSNGVQLITSTYNKYGEVTSITSTNGRTTYMEYDNNGDCIKTYYYENGIKILDETIYDETRRVVGRAHYVGDTTNPVWSTSTEYNAAGQVVREIDQTGLETRYTYDVRGLETEVRSQSKGSDGKIVWSIQRTVYDAVGHAIYSNSYVEGTPDEKINGSHTEYDRDGRSVRSEQLLGLVIGINANGNSFVESTGTVLASSSTTYNTAGWILSSTDSYGLVTEYVYNVFGETTQTRRELPNNGGWMVSETVYDSQGRVVFSTDSHLEGSTDTVYGTKSVYDDKGRSTGSIRYKDSKVTIADDGTSTVSALGTEAYRTSTAYDTKGRVQSSTDANGNTTTYEYDSLDRQIKVKQSNGLITETIYNSKGQVEKSIIRSGSEERVTSYKYDEFGNIVETTQPDGTKISAEYNEKGQKISETNQLGQTRTFEYDDNGQLIKVTLPEVNGQKPVYEYTYDAQGNQLTIKDPNGNVTSFTYDVNGNQLTRTLPDNDSTESFEYDSRGRVVRETSFEGVVTTYQYDKYDRLESKTFTQNGVSEVWKYKYDEYGRVSEINQNDVRITKTTYDAQGRTILIETPEGTVSYEYDEFGNQKSVKTDNDTPVNYTYDNFGRLKTVKYDNQTTTYEYDTFGNLSKTITDTGHERLVVAYQYDNMNRLIKLTNFVDANENGVLDSGDDRISQFDYDLDDLGRKEKATEVFGNDDSKTNIVDWTYDNAGRLVRETFDHYNDALDQAQEWEYDLVGNRTKQKLDIGIDDIWEAFTTYSYDVNDRLIEEIVDDLTAANKDKVTQYGYDHTQQTSKYVSENGTLVSATTFEYDLQGRMSVVTIITENRKEVTKYEYGADGIRTSAEQEVYENNVLVSKTRTEYLNDPLNITGYSQVLKQTETNVVTGGETVTTYVIGHQRISQLVVKNGKEQEYYFTFDGHGSTRVLLDAALAASQIYSFDAYGNAMGFDPADALTEFLYSGEQFDSKIGQQYLRARYYDPATGRFNRLDPFFGNLNDPQSLHKYLYTHADPVNGRDPSGMMTLGGISISMSIGSNMRGMNVGVVTQVAKHALFNIAKGVAKKALTDFVISQLFSEQIDNIKRELTLLAMSLAGASSNLVETANAFIRGYQEIMNWLQPGFSLIPTTTNVVTSIWKSLPGEYGITGQSVEKFVKKLKHVKYGAAIASAAVGVPAFIKFSGDILTSMGHSTHIDVPVSGALVVDAQVLLGSLPFFEHGQKVSLSYFSPAIFFFDDVFQDEYNVLYAVEFDKIIASVRKTVQEANTLGNNQYSAAASTYIDDLRHWFSPSITVTTSY
jgi:RHS repeat-associated protein